VVLLKTAWLKRSALLLIAVLFAMVAAACGNNAANEGSQGSAPETDTETQNPADHPAEEPAELSCEVRIDGSSTVFPISQAVAEEFMAIYSDVNVTVGLSGSSNGFKAIINGEADIANASRLIKDEEVAALEEKGEEAVQMPVAYDGITVVIHPENDWAVEMSVEQLKKIWEKGSTVTKWSDVDPSWPDEKITLYGPGTASGTYEYFTEEITGEAKVSREDYTMSEDDNVIVQGVANDKYAMGYFGYSYYEANAGKLKAVAIKASEDAPAVAPSLETIGDGSYKPLSREIYIYPLKSAMERPEVRAFIEYYMSEEGSSLAAEVGYVPLEREKYEANLAQLP
jgi:phosphate transport system substrate-binding protein